MSTTAKPASYDQVRKIWAKSLPAETNFWEQWFDTKGLAWKDSYAWRIDPNYEFQKELRAYVNVPEGGTVRVLDVGAGPLTALGKVWPGRELDLVPIDPLAPQYDKMMADFGITPLVRTQLGHGERLLDSFPPSSFDLVYAENCLDHSYDPILCLQQMLAAVKPGCYVITDHLADEGKAQNYRGLHQWNFTVEKGRFVLWRPIEQKPLFLWRRTFKIDVQNSLGEFAKVEAILKKGHVNASIKKLA